MTKQGILEGILAKEDVNRGRQIEFDYSKGLFLIAILFIHSFQVLGGGVGDRTTAYRIIYILCSMTGAPIFLFSMGLGTQYSSAGCLENVQSGGRLIGYQYLNNLAWLASLTLPYLLLGLFTDTSWLEERFLRGASLFTLYVNIFFIAGGIYLVLAFLRRLKTPLWLYAVLGLGINLFSPKLVGLQTGIAGIDYALGGIFGGQPYASFSVLNYLPYTLLGVVFGALLRRAADKRRLYLCVCCISPVLLMGFFLWLFATCPSFDELYRYISYTYVRPDAIRTVANTSAVLLLAAILFFASETIAKFGYVNRKLLYFSRHISKYYAVHATLFILVYGFICYRPLGFFWCFVLFLLDLVYTDVLVRRYNHWMETRRSSLPQNGKEPL